jgi:bacillithiol system protein YtxJ
MEFLTFTPETNLDEILNNSHQTPQVIFKHSTRCIISSMALKRLKLNPNFNIAVWVLDLLNHRDLSNQLATRFNTPHQSPQIFVLVNGQLKATASHEKIDCEFIQRQL